MNKYYDKLFENLEEGVTAHELLRKKSRSKAFWLIDVLVDNVFFVKDNFEMAGAFFLVLSKDKKLAELVHIDRDLTVKKTDITALINAAAGKRNFQYDSYDYKIFKKLQ